MDLSVGGVELTAVSVAGQETCIEVPSWRLCFDIGRCPPSAARRGHRVCFTHGHVDHLGGVAHHASLRDLWGMKPPEYLIPTPYVADLEALLEVWRRLDRAELPAVVRGVEAGQVLEAGKERRIDVFRSFHRIPTVGYALERMKQRLLPELEGVDPREIARRRSVGELVSVEVPEVEVAFCGDTTIAVVDREPLVRRARVLVLECTFLDERVDVERARKTGHVHLTEIIERAEAFADNEALVLTHFSARYSGDQILRILDRRVPRELRERIVPLLPEPPWAPT